MLAALSIMNISADDINCEFIWPGLSLKDHTCGTSRDKVILEVKPPTPGARLVRQGCQELVFDEAKRWSY